MSAIHPLGELDARYSSPNAEAPPWSDLESILDEAEIYWFTTVRTDGRPHTTPLIAIWMDGAMFMCTGDREQKASNLAANPNCSFATGCNIYGHGLDIVLEGQAVAERSFDVLTRLARRYKEKYEWTFTPRDGQFVGAEGNVATVYRVAPALVYGFGKGDPFSHTRWRFGQE